MSNFTRFEPSDLKPTDEQRKIQLSLARTILVEAHAGAAKTTTLAIKTGEALSRGLDPGKILILTFTEAARVVMAERLRKIGIAASVVNRMKIETFESFSEEILLGFEKNNPDFEKTRAKIFFNLADLQDYALAAILKASQLNEGRYDGLSFPTHNVAVCQFIDAQLSMKAGLKMLRDFDEMSIEESAESIDVPLENFLTFRAYEHLRCGDFDDVKFRGPFDATYDLARRCVEFLPHETPVASYRMILCDELHDLNEAAFVILRHLLRSGERCQFVGAGDKDQVIYQTLGAHPQYLAYRFNELDPYLLRLPLSSTYRHGPNLAFAAGFLKKKTILSPLKQVTEIQQLHYPPNTYRECADKVVAAVSAWKKHSNGKCAVLIRDKHQSIHIETALMQAGIGYQTISMGEYLHRKEILFFRGMIAIALGNMSAMESKRLRAAIVEALVLYGEITFKNDKGEIDEKGPEFAKKLIADDPKNLESFFSGKIEKSDADIKSNIVNAVNFARSLPPDARAGEALEGIYQRINIEQSVKRIHLYPYEINVVMKSIQGFIHAATISGKTLRDFSEWISEAEIFSSKKQKQQAVVVDCVANVKGMEFDHVVMPFLQDREFPVFQADYHGEENLFYIGITRAKERLTLISPNGSTQSPFVKKMELQRARMSADNAIRLAEEALETQQTEPARDRRTDLRVPFADRARARELGAWWDPVKGVWYVKPGVDLYPFSTWFIDKS